MNTANLYSVSANKVLAWKQTLDVTLEFDLLLWFVQVFVFPGEAEVLPICHRLHNCSGSGGFALAGQGGGGGFGLPKASSSLPYR